MEEHYGCNIVVLSAVSYHILPVIEALANRERFTGRKEIFFHYTYSKFLSSVYQLRHRESNWENRVIDHKEY